MSEVIREFKTAETSDLPKELFSPKDIEVKTELDNPLALSTVESIADYFNDVDEFVPAIIKKFVKIFKVNMVSNKRKSRQEFVKTLIQTEKEPDLKALEKYLKV